MSKVVCFGEVLWDVFPTHKKIGGAPLNVALRLNSFGNDVTMISSVGSDPDGKQIIDFIKENGISADEIQINDEYQTSHVNVILDSKGSATYTIEYPCAWDFIVLKKTSKDLVQNSDAFIFGSLVARNEVSGITLFELLKLARYKVFDVNLRAPHYHMILLEKLMKEADFIKFNDDELIEICTFFNFRSDVLEDNINFISSKTNTKNICVTLGGDGAIFYTNDTFFRSSGYKVSVKDTVGAGDSFLATLIDGILQGKRPEECLNTACAVGALVASKDGANPKISAREVQNLMQL
ncbi:carbohydrate kinase [Litoribaculum gwangyangense]|uniref:Carbohydrate kinase n=1 Tax=Litoribaculum gwangyangense TaxID=1130722 RepID=A0ABP9CRA7_9FLAO